MTSLMKHKENETYQLVPGLAHEDAWHVRILEGPFAETVIQYGKVTVNETEEHLTFDFTIISSPDEDLTSENVDLKLYAGDILEECIRAGIEEGSAHLKERNEK